MRPLLAESHFLNTDKPSPSAGVGWWADRPDNTGQVRGRECLLQNPSFSKIPLVPPTRTAQGQLTQEGLRHTAKDAESGGELGRGPFESGC